jgi:hypothetical protein
MKRRSFFKGLVLGMVAAYQPSLFREGPSLKLSKLTGDLGIEGKYIYCPYIPVYYTPPLDSEAFFLDAMYGQQDKSK